MTIIDKIKSTVSSSTEKSSSNHQDEQQFSIQPHPAVCLVSPLFIPILHHHHSFRVIHVSQSPNITNMITDYSFLSRKPTTPPISRTRTSATTTRRASTPSRPSSAVASTPTRSGLLTTPRAHTSPPRRYSRTSRRLRHERSSVLGRRRSTVTTSRLRRV
jgi:hypothetical protein